MNTLRQAVQEYLNMRRSLEYKLQDAGKLHRSRQLTRLCSSKLTH